MIFPLTAIKRLSMKSGICPGAGLDRLDVEPRHCSRWRSKEASYRWEMHRLGDVATVVSGSTPKPQLKNIGMGNLLDYTK